MTENTRYELSDQDVAALKYVLSDWLGATGDTDEEDLPENLRFQVKGLLDIVSELPTEDEGPAESTDDPEIVADVQVTLTDDEGEPALLPTDRARAVMVKAGMPVVKGTLVKPGFFEGDYMVVLPSLWYYAYANEGAAFEGSADNVAVTMVTEAR